ncbi:MAG: DUF4124 domain-containing protein [Moraxella sp.]|nr:DUF4124 domain-containing protein [Moraxella sp.]
MKQTTKYMAMFVAGILGLSAISSSAAVTQIYRSVGAHGEVKYSQFPPKDGNNVEALEFRSDGRQNTPGEMAAPAIDPNAQQQSQVAELQKQVQDLENRENAQRCQTLRSNLANLNIGGRIYETNAQGERVYMNDQEIGVRRDRIQQAINEHCKGV